MKPNFTNNNTFCLFFWQKKYYLLWIVGCMLLMQNTWARTLATDLASKEAATKVNSASFADSCSFLSTLPCTKLQVSLPYNLNFDAPVANTLADSNKVGTGFTLALPYSGLRVPEDSAASIPNVPGYEPTNLSLINGMLRVVSHKGSAFGASNNQVNALAVQVDTRNKLQIETTLLNPYSGISGEQAGLWVGRNDKTYLKLVVVGNQIELRREVNDVSEPIDQLITGIIPGLDTQKVRLRLVLDPATNTAQAFYSTDSITYLNVGAPNSTLNLADMGLMDSRVYTGIFATYSNGTVPIAYSFDNFSISLPGTPVAVQAPANQIIPGDSVFSFSVGQYIDPDGQPLTYTATLQDGSPLPTWITFTSTALTFSGTTPSDGADLKVKITAIDPSNLAVITYFDFKVPPIPCSPFSILYCSKLPVSLPYILRFDTPKTNTLPDQYGFGTGFTMALPYSGTRLPEDSTVSYPNAPGYEPTQLHLNAGTLQVTTHKGQALTTSNNQLNTLGVQVNGRNKLQIETTLLNPYNGTSGEQAGLWVGRNDKNYVKLVVTGNQIELRREVKDISDSVDYRIAGFDPGLSFPKIHLRLVLDPVTNTAEGFYSTDSINYLNVAENTYTANPLSLDSMSLNISRIYTGIFATHGNGITPVTYSFGNFSVKSVNPPIQPKLAFLPDYLNYTVVQGGSITNQNTALTPNIGTPIVSLTKDTIADWLTLPAARTGILTFGPDQINTNLTPGTYLASVIAQADGYQPDTVQIQLTVNPPIPELLVNFQDSATVPPTGWLVDFGQPFGLRTGSNQGTNLWYGWKKRSDQIPLDLSGGGTMPGNGRNRTIPADVRLATFMHMQADDINGAFDGIKEEGYWEIKVPNGFYDVTVTVGDAIIDTSATESHSLNVEGIQAISHFEPSGREGSPSRFKTATARVQVQDSLLTITADGGVNTKINSASIVPVSTGPFAFWSTNSQEITIRKDYAPFRTFSLELNNSSNLKDITYALKASYDSGVSGWLRFSTSHAGTEPNVIFDYSSARTLPPGTYTATVSATAPGFEPALLTVKITVLETENILPYVVSSTPENGQTDVNINTVSIAANNLYVPEVVGFRGGVDNSTLNTSTVKLFKITATDTTEIVGVVQGTGGGDAISFSPTYALEPNTSYKFIITTGVKSNSGQSFLPYEAIFTTGGSIGTAGRSKIAFSREPIPSTMGKQYTSVTIGPDGKFYALRQSGTIERFDINSQDGTLSNMEAISILEDKYGERTAIGLTFDPASTPTNLIAWVTHSSGGFTTTGSFDGNLSKLSGPGLQNEQLVITRLPRSTKDHLTNSVQFGPDGALYISQGSHSSMGAYDASWQLEESLLAGAILRLDVSKLASITLPLNARTTADQSLINTAPSEQVWLIDGTYNPYATNAPLTIYASGIRNAYDLVWHSNGQLYAPTNGSAAGGNTPQTVVGTRRPDGTVYNGPAVAPTKLVQVQNDFLFRINPQRPIGYFGHPNPMRGEYVAHRGFTDNNLYPVGTVPDANYRGPSFDFGLNKSPNGVIEYKSDAFNGVLKGKLLVCRFSGGGDIIILEPGATVYDPAISPDNDQKYDIVSFQTGSGLFGIEGLSGFTNPLDIAEDVQTGNLYVIEYNWNNARDKTSQITLLRPKAVTDIAPIATVTPTKITDNDIVDGKPGKKNTITVGNSGNTDLTVTGIVLEGVDSSQFELNGISDISATSPLIIAANTAFTFNVRFNATSPGIKTASVKISFDNYPDTVVVLNGLGTTGGGTSNEPSLQAIVNAHGLKINIGDDDSNTPIIHSVNSTARILGEEVIIKKFIGATDAPVTVEPLAVFANQDVGGIATALGWYAMDSTLSAEELFTVANERSQTLNVQGTGKFTFDPGSTPFGFYTRWPSLANRLVYSKDSLNTFPNTLPHHFRVYPVKDQNDSVVANTYLIAVEGVSEDQDYQDMVFIVRNINPVTDTIVLGNKPSIPDNSNSGLVLQAYPNPNTGDKINIVAKNFARKEEITIAVYELSGRLIYSKNIVADSQGTATTQLSPGNGISSGMYLIKAQSLSGVVYTKLLVER
ncbi:T9SS type A sorting domain-containing protein [Adhaeribacter radiodurans]|uniref:Ig-like domain-containing protein n=1 Tax=Adhaeribacter radiodurans TaxID=2745197 RepID=A0A7L7LF20_9BACT|nr:T9SS type A sorting domain-containing protein [Adhaeribacter radiodurans]QMU31383.1 Ig-like domain-containing protein [Adhaeribacter radiodurans]